jgi:iron complex transport system ATP-binding protein
MEILKVNNLCIDFENREILKNISLHVKQGEILGVIGPNGSGKTTLFRSICGSLKPKSGNVIFNDKDISEYSAGEISKNISAIPQMVQILYPFTVEEFVLMGRFPHSGRYGYSQEKDYAVMNRVIEMTDIGSIRNRRMSELSGGERQRVIIAQGFVQEANFMMLDEPTAHLDIYHQVQLLNLLDKYNNECGVTILVVLHDLNLAASYCDRLVLMKKGAIYKEGSVAEVLTYQNIEEVYQTPVIVKENPITHKPHIFLITGNK